MSHHPLNEKWQTYWNKKRLTCVCTLRHEDITFLESLEFEYLFHTDPTEREMTYEVHLMSALGKAAFYQEVFHCRVYMPGDYYPFDDAIELIREFFEEVEVYLYFNLSAYERSIYEY